MHAARALLLCLALAAPAAAAAEPDLVSSLGFAWFSRGDRAGTTREASGVALELRLEGRPQPIVGWGVTLTWGLTDWDRAGKWIDAGNRAGSWTSEKFADVEAWVRRASEKDRGARLLGAMFADLFLALTYAAVPACYAGSLGGATSHLQLDLTGSFHLAEGPNDAWLELGAGAAVLPENVVDWRRALGPVAGVGARFGFLRVNVRALWSPPGANTSSLGGAVVTGAATLSIVR